jgi:hypothetical protein
MSHNNITGDKIATKLGSDEAKRKFDDGFERIFGVKTKKEHNEAEKSALVIMEDKK